MTIASLGSEEKTPRKTAENTVKHRDGGVGSVVANHRSAAESSVVVTTLPITTDVARSMVCVCVCVCVCWTYGWAVKKTVELIQMRFGGWLMWA